MNKSKEKILFDLLSETGSSPYKQSKCIDKILGYKVAKIERKLSQKYRSYDKYNDPTNKKKDLSVLKLGLA